MPARMTKEKVRFAMEGWRRDVHSGAGSPKGVRRSDMVVVLVTGNQEEEEEEEGGWGELLIAAVAMGAVGARRLAGRHLEQLSHTSSESHS